MSGVITGIEAPRMMPAPSNNWRIGTLILGGMLILPFLFCLWLTLLIVKLLLSFVFHTRSGPGGRSLMDEIIFYRGLELLMQKKEPIPFYHIILSTPSGKVMVRQEGEFEAGQPTVGHQSTFWGSRRNGVVVVAGGRDDTLGVEFRHKPNIYKFAFFALLVLIGIAAMLLLSAPRLH